MRLRAHHQVGLQTTWLVEATVTIATSLARGQSPSLTSLHLRPCHVVICVTGREGFPPPPSSTGNHSAIVGLFLPYRAPRQCLVELAIGFALKLRLSPSAASPDHEALSEQNIPSLRRGGKELKNFTPLRLNV